MGDQDFPLALVHPQEAAYSPGEFEPPSLPSALWSVTSTSPPGCGPPGRCGVSEPDERTGVGGPPAPGKPQA
jgi:hypothetical protein